MIENEKEFWEEIINNSTLLLKKLRDLDEEKHEQLEESELFHAKYINVLFGIRSAIESKNELYDFISNLDSGKSARIDTYEFHKSLRKYLADIDSALDYIDKLYKQLKQQIDKNIYFNRKDEQFANDISDLRNSIIHEGVPTIRTDEEVIENGGGCHTDVSSFRTVNNIVKLKFKIKNNGYVEWELRNLINYTFNSTINLIRNKTNELNDYFK